MEDSEKLKVFEKHLKMIKSAVIRDFTEYCLVRFPNYFWTLPASTSGRRHGGEETLIDHIQGCLFLAECVIDQMNDVWTKRQKDQLISALILHDGWRCHGTTDEECRYTEEMLEKKGIEEKTRLLGKLCTDPEHPEAGYREVLRLALEYNRENPQAPINTKDLSIIGKAVRCHYGPWTKTPNIPFSLDWPFSSVVMQVHNIDYQQACNSKYFNRIKK